MPADGFLQIFLGPGCTGPGNFATVRHLGDASAEIWTEHCSWKSLVLADYVGLGDYGDCIEWLEKAKENTMLVSASERERGNGVIACEEMNTSTTVER